MYLRSINKLLTISLFSLYTAMTFAQKGAVIDQKLKITRIILEKISQQFDCDPLKTRSLVEIVFEYDSAFFANGSLGRHLISTKKFDSGFYKRTAEIDKFQRIRPATDDSPLEIFWYDSELNPPFSRIDSINKIFIKIERPIFGWGLLYLLNIYKGFPDPTHAALFDAKKIDIPVTVFYGQKNRFVNKNLLFEFEISDSKSLNVEYVGLKSL
jgi:hypothetical protein